MRVPNNYWGTTATALIDAAIIDYNDDFNKGHIFYQPILTTPAETTYPFVWDVVLSTEGNPDATIVGAEPVTFTVTFNRDMDTSVQPSVSFGPDVPNTDYTVHPVNGGWQNPRIWVGTFNINPITGDGYQLMRIAGPARAASDPWLVIGDDTGRFRFEIITSGTEAMNLQANGVEGAVELSWTQDDFDMLAGYNLYRSNTADGTYTRINSTIIPPAQKSFRDTSVQPGQTYYYKFTVVKTDMSESKFSNIAAGTPVDTIAPVINHTPVSKAAVGLPLQIYADVTDNVHVSAVTLYYRATGQAIYQNRAMVNTTGSRYSATLEGSLIIPPGIEYYIEATDGVGIVRHGRVDSPYRITVTDNPEVTAVSPNKGPAGGGSSVTVSGSNFKEGASVTFGGAVASNVTLVSSNQLTCITPAHFPAAVDVSVINPGGGSSALLRAFTYESDTVLVSLPDASGDNNAIVEIPISLTGVSGLRAADITVQFNSSVLTARGARTGNLTPGFSVEANTATPGQIRISLASATAMSGTGVLTYLEFLVNGVPSTSTDLILLSVSLNSGAIPVILDNGTFTVKELLDVSGAVRYYQGSRPVPGVTLTLEGNQSFSQITDTTGSYSINGVPDGNYSLTPGKSDDTGAITSYDASFILRHAVGLISLSEQQRIAADVDKSGIIDAMDAAYVLERAVGILELPFPGAGKIWDFVPTNRSYQPLSADMSSQDFTAILIGDVSGNWGQSGTQGAGMTPQQITSAQLYLTSGRALPSGQFTIPLKLNLQQAQLYGADIVLSYEPSIAIATSVDKGYLSGNFSMAVNLNQPGEIRIAMAGATPITSGGDLLLLTFQANGEYGSSSPLEISSAMLNESGIPATLHGSILTIAIPGDVDLNRSVDIVDLTTVASQFNTTVPPTDTYIDLNGDGVVDILDLVQVAFNLGRQM